MKRLLQRIRDEASYYRALLAHPRTPRSSRWLLGLALAYLASPIDLIPDAIPVLGLLDDLLLVPGLVFLALRFVPADVKAACRSAQGGGHRQPPPPESTAPCAPVAGDCDPPGPGAAATGRGALRASAIAGGLAGPGDRGTP